MQSASSWTPFSHDPRDGGTLLAIWRSDGVHLIKDSDRDLQVAEEAPGFAYALEQTPSSRYNSMLHVTS